jgi:hypothetical protein
VGGAYAILARHGIAVPIVVLGAIERKKGKGKNSSRKRRREDAEDEEEALEDGEL